MIYVVTGQEILFPDETFKVIPVEESIEMLSSWGNLIQYDSETDGLDPLLGTLLTMQFGRIDSSDQIIVDCTTVSPLIYKDILEKNTLIGTNLKFDLKWLFNYGIHPMDVYDCMIVEQLLYLGFPYRLIGADTDIILEYSEWLHRDNNDLLNEKDKRQKLYLQIPELAEFLYEHSGASLKAMCWRYLGVELDKTVRGQIKWRGIDPVVCEYAADDVVYMYRIMCRQLKRLRRISSLKAAQIECKFVPCCAYYEWCGVKLDVPLWQEKMKKDYTKLCDAAEKLDDFVIRQGDDRFFNRYIQLGLFDNPEDEPKPRCTINWQSSKQVIPFLKSLGFNTLGIDKKTKELKDTTDMKVLKPQKGINDEFLDIYKSYSEAYKVCSTYGQQYINAVNPKDGRIHTEFRQLGTDTGRLACGSEQINKELAELKGLPTGKPSKTKGIENVQQSKMCAYPQVQNLPKEALTRQCFCADKGNIICACDYSSEESRLMASTAQDEAMIDEYIHGDGDMHSLTAKMVFKDELKDVPVKDIKEFSRKNHAKGGIDYRQEAKGYEFLFNYHGNADTLMRNYGLSRARAEEIEHNYMDGFNGLKNFQDSQCKFVCQHGYILISPVTGHKSWWWDYPYWKKVQESFTSSFWEEYRNVHKGTKDQIDRNVKQHFREKTEYEKNSCNSPCQGAGAIIFKQFNRTFLEWIISEGLFGKVKFCIPVHDEIVCEIPEELSDRVIPKLKEIMKKSAEPYCTRLPMPADEEVGKYWIHE